jgi:effector-binding domain-containing protein
MNAAPIRPRHACLAIALALAAVPSPASAQGKDGEPVIGELIVQTIPAKQYIHAGFETDFKSMVPPIRKALTEMIKAANENKEGLHGPLMHFYYGAPHTSPAKTFKMETGFFVPDGAKGVGDFKVRELPAYKCATMLYTGPGLRIGEAWQKIYRTLGDKGLTPTGEERELYLYWEGPDSPNNIVQVQIGVR